jgi:hypothetical protein
MENKIVSQEWKLINELLDLVNSQEEFEYLVAWAREICPEYLTSLPRQMFGLSLVFPIIFERRRKENETGSRTLETTECQ